MAEGAEGAEGPIGRVQWVYSLTWISSKTPSASSASSANAVSGASRAQRRDRAPWIHGRPPASSADCATDDVGAHGARFQKTPGSGPRGSSTRRSWPHPVLHHPDPSILSAERHVRAGKASARPDRAGPWPPKSDQERVPADRAPENVGAKRERGLVRRRSHREPSDDLSMSLRGRRSGPTPHRHLPTHGHSCRPAARCGSSTPPNC